MLDHSVNFSHGGNVHLHPQDVIDFSANINPLGLPETVLRSLNRSLKRIVHYPEPHAESLRAMIAKYWKIDEKNILVGNGSAEFMYLIARTFSPKTAVLAVPSFTEYERALRSVDARIDYTLLAESNTFRLEQNDFSSADIAFICNPNNPTGNLLIPQGRPAWRFPRKLLVVDEAFMDFLPDEKDLTLIHTACTRPDIAVLRTFTKFFAIPGLRLGYMVAHPDVIQQLSRFHPPWSANTLATTAAAIFLNDNLYREKTLEMVEQERAFLSKGLQDFSCFTLYPSRANYLLVRIISGKMNADILADKLLQKKVLIRKCSNFRILDNTYFRIAVRKRDENQLLINAISDFVS